ncbi:MAG: hypothetical protein FWD47_14770 [Treponema sp.]|nr:hypothetical protein [Treponema sp.]
MGIFFAKLLELISTGNKKIIVRIITITCLLLVVFPLGLSYFYENIRLEQEINILKELDSINKNDITDERLKDYYENLVNKTVNRKSFPILITIDIADRNTVINNSHNKYFNFDNVTKFISGSFWWLLLLIIGIFVKQDTIGTKIALLIFLTCLVALFGFIGVSIPSFTPRIINIIGFPMLQFIIGFFIGLLIVKIKKINK